MKKLRFYFIVLLIICCGKRQSNTVNEVNKSQVTDNKKPDTFQVFDSKRDTIELFKAYEKAIELCKRRVRESEFEINFDTVTYGRMTWSCRARFGRIFSGENRYLLLNRISAFGSDDVLYTDIFIYRDGLLKKIGSDTSGIGFNSEEVYDINGDGYLDYLMSSYSPAGCCPRDEDVGLIYAPERGSFIRESFFNPEYFPGQKLVYETGYGYAGAVEIEKYKWRGTSKIKVEKIEPKDIGVNIAGGKTPEQIRRVKYPDETEEVLNFVPREYKRLRMYKHFMALY